LSIDVKFQGPNSTVELLVKSDVIVFEKYELGLRFSVCEKIGFIMLAIIISESIMLFVVFAIN